MPKHVAKEDHRFEIATGFARKYHGMPIKVAMKLLFFQPGTSMTCHANGPPPPVAKDKEQQYLRLHRQQLPFQ
jgi:hypothetical protein